MTPGEFVGCAESTLQSNPTAVGVQWKRIFRWVSLAGHANATPPSLHSLPRYDACRLAVKRRRTRIAVVCIASPLGPALWVLSSRPTFPLQGVPLVIHTTMLLLASAAMSAAADFPRNVIYQYEGEVVSARGDAEASRKKFVCRFVAADDGESPRFWWWLTQQRHGDWAWPDQFGQVTIAGHGSISDGRLPQLVYDHAKGYTQIPLTIPLLLTDEPLRPDSRWKRGKLEFQVTDDEKAEPASSWSIRVTTPLGERARLLVGKETPLVESVTETVFIGAGTEHRLTMSLTQIPQPAKTLAALRAAFTALQQVRSKLDLKPLVRQRSWTEQQLATLKEELPAALELAENTPAQELVLQAAKTARLQKAIAQAVARLQEKTMGKKLPVFRLRAASIGGKPVGKDDLAGKAAVLHFWSYQDEPLVQPYGQTGYLDFLHRKHQADGVVVLGVTVDDRLLRADQRTDAIRGVRRLKSFMNLSYRVLLDDAHLLAQVGDPRDAGGELPLFLVVDTQGRIVHFHSGFYQVNQEQGLAELDRVIEAVKKGSSKP